MVIRVRWALALALLASSCAQRSQHGQAPSGAAEPTACVDLDSDGFGDGCAVGADCDDHDPLMHVGCLRCATPAEGCACDESSPPTQCFLEPTEGDAGAVMCHEGTRYCRGGEWSGCEGITTYVKPEQSTSALIDLDAGITRCNDCNVICFRVTDNLDPVDGGLNNTSTNVDWVAGGGLTLKRVPDDAGTDAGAVGSEVSSDPPPCTLGVGADIDCDGIPNNLDPYPNDPPFATANPSLFLQIGPGQTGTGQIDLDFFLNSADVYFLVDQTGSMAEERDQLKHDLTTGDFIHDASYACADYDFDRQPNNELKSQGIVGAVKCKIRDANFGAGFFREIPFNGYGDDDQVAFGHFQDITGNVANVLTAINRLTTIGNEDWPEASMIGLHNVLTGGGMYFGTTKRGVPARNDCPENRWGYPCFRDDAVPIVLLFTDAQFHNGPSSNTRPYSSPLNITAGSDNIYHPLDNTNEAFNGAAVLGDLTSAYKSYTGDTTSMAADLTSTLVGSSCISSSAGPDAMFRFNLTQQRAVTIESTGSQFDTVLGLFTGVPGTPTVLAASTNTNETGTTAKALGQAKDSYVQISGNTSAMAADYDWSTISCDAATGSPDAVFKFDVSSTTQVALDTSGSAFDTVVSLYSAAPALPPTYTALLVNLNDDNLTAYSAGEVYNQIRAFSGNTSLLAANYSQSQIGCNAASAGKDAVYSFTLSMPTRVRISSEGSSFDTVLALYDNLANPVGSSAASGNDTQALAYNAGTLDGRILQVTGTTAGMIADYSATQFGCSSTTTSPDTMFKFHLDTPRDVQIDTSGTSWDTVLSVFTNTNIDPKTYVTATNTSETIATAQDLGTIDSKDIVVTGGNTTSMTADYDSTGDVSCSNSDSAPDTVYKFHLNADRRIKVDLDTSSFDTTLSVRKPYPAEASTAVSANTNDALASIIDVGDIYHKSFLKTGNNSGLNHNYSIGCSSNSTAKDSILRFSLSAATTVQIDTIGTGWNTVLGLYPDPLIDTDPPTPASTSLGTSYDTRTTAYDIGTLDGLWKTYTGDTNSSSVHADWSSDSSCGADSSAKDIFVKFTLATPRTVNINTSGSSFDTVLFLYRYTNVGQTTWTKEDCDHVNGGTESITKSLVAGTYFIIVKGDKDTDKGTYALSVRDNILMSNQISCDNDSGGLTTSKITAALSAGTYDLVLSGAAATANGAYTVRFRDKTWWDTNTEIQCHDDIVSGTNNSSRIERDYTAGDYYFTIKGYGSTSKGAYALRVSDVNNLPNGPGSDYCDDNGGGGTVSQIVRTSLAAGDYWVGLKGKSTTGSTYKLNLKDMSATASGATLQCDDDGGDSPQSSIERDLQAGTYQVVLKGKAATDYGAYKISMRDLTNKPITRLACANDGGAGTSSYLEQSLAAGTYYAVVKGNAATDKGAFTLSMRDVTSRPITSTTCNDNGSTYNTSKITRTLDPGTYYVALKGKDATQKGGYQLSLGGGSTHSSTYTPPPWSTTLAAIQDTQARVIPILSCHDDSSHGNVQGDCNEARTQATALANASEALGANLQPLVFDIDKNGGGLSDTVVGAISSLAAYLEMNVSVRVLFDPDDNPGFVVAVHAIDQTGDGCSGLIGITHQHCTPGATPRFQIDFTNPAAPNNVPVNPMDSKGGYNFRVELVGDNQFVIENVPVYIIPEPAAAMGPPAPQYYPDAEYHQDVAAPGCSGNEAPDWRDLSWVADVYGNTSITFQACAAQQQAGLASCVPHTVATVRGAGNCTSNSNCPLGYCDTDIGVCQIATAGTCANSTDCPSNAFCEPTSRMCTFTSQPVYIGAALGPLNFNSYMRMSIALDGTPPFTNPPVLHHWEMTYLCSQVL